MSYTYKALTLVWLTVFGLAALSGSGMIVGWWVLLLVGAALVMPALTLSLCSKPRAVVGAITTSQRRREASAIDVENEVPGPRPFSGSVPEPVPVVQ